jgi:hypothetical protein
LRVDDPKVFDLIVNTIQQGEAHDRAADAHLDGANIFTGEAARARALEPLSVVATPTSSITSVQPLCGSVSVFALMERHNETITEIDCFFWST